VLAEGSVRASCSSDVKVSVTGWIDGRAVKKAGFMPVFAGKLFIYGLERLPQCVVCVYM